jgi:hypothetical protein
MSTVRFIKKTPAGGAGNFEYEYSCTCGSGAPKPNVKVTAANDNTARTLAQLQCDNDCGESLLSAGYLDVSQKEPSEAELAKAVPMTTVKPMTYTNYSFREDVYWDGDRLYGRWSQELSVVCSSVAVFGFYYAIQLVSGPEYFGACSGKQVIKIETR